MGNLRVRRYTPPVAQLDEATDVHESLGASDEAVEALLREGSSANTVASYRSALRYWQAWHVLRYRQPLAIPSSVKVVLQFIADHAEHQGRDGLCHDLPLNVDEALVLSKAKRRPGSLSLATIQHRIAVLSEAHEARAAPNPCRSRSVMTLLERTRTAYAKRGVSAARKDALTKEPLERLLATCDDSLIGLRDKALLLFAWASGGRRRSEVVRATMENTRRLANGYLFKLGHSKTNQQGVEGADTYKPVAGRAAIALDAWIEASGIKSGPIFRRLYRGGGLGAQLQPDWVRKMVQARAIRAGLVGNYAAHSLRSGFVTEAGLRGVPLGETMAMTGHASPSSVCIYHQAGISLTSRVGHLLDIDPDQA